MIQLDTSIVVASIRGDATINHRLERCFSEVRISSIALAELEYGARVSAHPERNLAALAEFRSSVGVVNFDEACAAEYGRLRSTLHRLGRPIGENGTLIAAAARVHGATLVTRNERHFRAIEGLSLDVW